MSESSTGKPGNRSRKSKAKRAASTDKDIEQIMLDGTEIDRAMNEAVEEAIEAHARAGVPIAVWRNGRVVVEPARVAPTKSKSVRRAKSAKARAKTRS